MSRQVTHEVAGGYCRICGELAEYLESIGADVVYLTAT